MMLPLAVLSFGLLFMLADGRRARKRILTYCEGAGLEVRSLTFTLGWRGPFSPFRGTHIFRGVLTEQGSSEEFTAWFNSAGLITVTADDPLEVKFAP